MTGQTFQDSTLVLNPNTTALLDPPPTFARAWIAMKKTDRDLRR
jgi:hypothetical protein